MLAIIGSIELLRGDSSLSLTLTVRHAPYEPCAGVEDHFVKYFNAVEVVCNEGLHFNQVNYHQEWREVHVEELRNLVVIAEAKDNSKDEATAKEYSR